jgi:GNAT superfamily N-acetyltransferase
VAIDNTPPASLSDGYEGPAEVTDRDALEEIFRLRGVVWAGQEWLTKHQDMVRLADSYEGRARHWVVRQRGQLVAAARLSLHNRVEDVPDFEFFPTGFAIAIPPPPIASINRLVVHPAHRRQGIATLLDRCRTVPERVCQAETVFPRVAP